MPPYARRSKSLEVLIPALYLISTGDFAEALAALLGPDAGGLSASTVARLTEVCGRWLKRDLSARHYDFWADGIVQARLEDDANAWVIIGATPELVGLIDGVRESAQSWRELTSNGAGSRSRPTSPSPTAREGDRGSVAPDPQPDKTANVLNKLPKSQPRRQSVLSRSAERRDSPSTPSSRPTRRQGGRLPGKDRETSWRSTTFPPSIGSICAPPTPSKAPSRHRDTPCDPSLSNKTALAMAPRPQNSWRRLDGHNQLPKLIEFINGIAVRQQPQAAPDPNRPRFAIVPPSAEAMTAPRPREQRCPPSPPDRLPPRRGGHRTFETASAARLPAARSDVPAAIPVRARTAVRRPRLRGRGQRFTTSTIPPTVRRPGSRAACRRRAEPGAGPPSRRRES